MSELQHILETARKLFERYGIKSISMDDIAKELGISKKTLYQQVEGKQDLISQTVMLSMNEEEDLLEKISKNAENAIEEMRGIANYVLDFLNNLNPRLIFDLQKFYPESWSLIEEGHFRFIKKIITDNINRGKQEGLYRDEINTAIIADLYVSNSKHFIIESMMKLDYPPADVFTEMILYHLHGIMSDKGEQLFNKNKTSVYAEV